jgi:hypothetical protein
MIRVTLALVFAGLLLTVSSGVALDRWMFSCSAREARGKAHAELEAASRLTRLHPGAFGQAGSHPGVRSLKGLVQEAATQRQVQIASLSESEREVSRGRREHQVLVRIENARHIHLLEFFSQLEANAGGGRIREIRLRPSTGTPDTYEDAEVVVAKILPAQEDKP